MYVKGQVVGTGDIFGKEWIVCMVLYGCWKVEGMVGMFDGVGKDEILLFWQVQGKMLVYCIWHPECDGAIIYIAK